MFGIIRNQRVRVAAMWQKHLWSLVFVPFFTLVLMKKMVGRDMSNGYENLANIASCSAYKCRLSDVKQSCGDWRERRLCLDGRTGSYHYG